MSEIPGLTPIPYDSDPWTAGHMKDHELVAAHLGLPAPVVGTWGHIAGHTKIAARLGVDVPGDTNKDHIDMHNAIRAFLRSVTA